MMAAQFGRGMRVGIVGAGAMGSGIAQVAATYGHPVVLFDTQQGSIDKGLAGIEKNLARSVEKNRLTKSERETALRMARAHWRYITYKHFARVAAMKMQTLSPFAWHAIENGS